MTQITSWVVNSIIINNDIFKYKVYALSCSGQSASRLLFQLFLPALTLLLSCTSHKLFLRPTNYSCAFLYSLFFPSWNSYFFAPLSQHLHYYWLSCKTFFSTISKKLLFSIFFLDGRCSQLSYLPTHFQKECYS